MRSLISQQGNIIIIPCGTDIERFGSISRNEGRAKLEIDLEDKVILYVGRFDRRKGIETLVRAVGCPEVKRHSNLKLIIVGGSTPGKKDGKEKERIEGIVNELGLKEITTFCRTNRTCKFSLLLRSSRCMYCSQSLRTLWSGSN